MDNRITKNRLNDHISYDWWKYLAIVLGVIFLLSLIFTMASARLKPGENMELFFLGDEYTKMSQEEVSSFGDKLSGGGYLTPAVLEVNANYYDISDATMSTAVSTRVGAGDGDIVFSSYFGALLTYIDNAGTSALALGDIIQQAKDQTEYSYDEAGKQTFQEQHKFYRNEEELRAAMDAENARIREYRAQAEKLEDYFEAYPELRFDYRQQSAYNEYMELTKTEGADISDQIRELGEEKLWALNCKPMINKMKGRLIYWVYSEEEIDEEIADTQEKLHFDTYLMVLMPRSRTIEYFLECLSVFNCMIETYYLNPAQS